MMTPEQHQLMSFRYPGISNVIVLADHKPLLENSDQKPQAIILIRKNSALLVLSPLLTR